MDYYEMWERFKEEIQMALDEARECGYDDPSSENYDKYWTYLRVMNKIEKFERYRKDSKL